MNNNNLKNNKNNDVYYSYQKKDEITDRIICLIDNSKLNVTHDLKIMKAILTKYNFKTVPNASNLLKRSKQGLYAKVGRDDFPHEVIDGVPFVIPQFVL
jgi:hypothetical protein